MRVDDQPCFGSCVFCDKTFKTQEEAFIHVAPCKARFGADRDKDVVNNPEHYKSHPSGVQCIQVTEQMNFCLGNVIKYVWRADMKGGVEDLKKARWYIDREIKRRDAE